MKKTIYAVAVLLLATIIVLTGCTEKYEVNMPSDKTSVQATVQESLAKSSFPEKSDSTDVETGKSIIEPGSMASGAKASSRTSGGQNITSKTSGRKNTSGSTTTVLPDNTTTVPSNGT